MTSIARSRPSRPRPTMKTQCQRDPNSSACLEEKLSNLRSTPVLARRTAGVPIDPQLGVGGGMYLNVIGAQTQALEKEIEKKSWRRI